MRRYSIAEREQVALNFQFGESVAAVRKSPRCYLHANTACTAAYFKPSQLHKAKHFKLADFIRSKQGTQ
ncbi:hypothetical protein [Microcoleus sp. herbarium13]|uniref:hypothetical protein n=1 Tax=Microcoleus sp. herbarium13 TaxID=3055438 RepID=UPI002FD01CC0